MALSAKPTRAAKAAHKVLGGIQFILLVLAIVAGLPFILALAAIGFIWKLIDEL